MCKHTSHISVRIEPVRSRFGAARMLTLILLLLLLIEVLGAVQQIHSIITTCRSGRRRVYRTLATILIAIVHHSDQIRIIAIHALVTVVHADGLHLEAIARSVRRQVLLGRLQARLLLLLLICLLALVGLWLLIHEAGVEAGATVERRLQRYLEPQVGRHIARHVADARREDDVGTISCRCVARVAVQVGRAARRVRV